MRVPLNGSGPALTAAVLAGAAVALGCGGRHEPGSGEQRDAGEPSFVATQADFACYRDWTAFDGGTDAFDGLGLPDAQRTIYINKLPPPGSAAFPVGTIIVKDVANAQTFAMAKRGDGFNPPVDDWEWFELITAATDPPTACAPLINWRGTAPPSGMVYGGQFTQCNGCHEVASGNDYVAGSALMLSQQ